MVNYHLSSQIILLRQSAGLCSKHFNSLLQLSWNSLEDHAATIANAMWKVAFGAEHMQMTPFELTFAKLVEHTLTSVAVLAVKSFYHVPIHFVWNSLCNICWVFEFMVSFDWYAYPFHRSVSFVFILFASLILPQIACLISLQYLGIFHHLPIIFSTMGVVTIIAWHFCQAQP
jgi:hypothetical protein